MDIEFIGANCFEIVINKQSFVVDVPTEEIAKKLPKFKNPVVLKTTEQGVIVPEENKFKVDGPGEYEVESVSINGVQTPAHTQVHDSEFDSNTAYVLRTGSIKLCVLGHAAAKLSEQVFEAIGAVDILIVPVGGGGYTLDAKSAAKMVKEFDPSIVIPSHYEHKGVNYESPQDDLQKFLDEIGGNVIREDSLKMKKVETEENLDVYVLRPKLAG